MFNPKMFLSLFLLVFLLAFPSLFAQETITITTYYPSPYGSYGYLHTDKFGVGDNDGSGGPTEADIPTTSGNVWIAGNVGIGTTAPGTKLHVSQNQTTIADNTALVTLESIGTATVNKGRVLDVYTTRGDGFTDGYIAQFRNLVDTKMYIRGDGNVGIGTTGPLSNLHVVTAANGYDGTMRVGGNGASFGLLIEYDQDAATVGTIYSNPTYTNTNALLKMGVDGDANPNQLVLKGDGNVGIGTTGPGQKLDVLSTDTDVARFRGSSSGIRFQSNAATMDIISHNGTDNGTRNLLIRQYAAYTGILLDTSGYVGIGTTAPYSELHVNGNIAISGNPGSTRYLLLNETNTGSTQLIMQAGAGSATYGGGINVYGHSHATRPGWVVAGISNGSGGKFSVDNSGTGGTSVFNVDASGNVTGTYGNYHVSSDIRRKKDIVTIPNALEKVLSLRGVNFRWRDSKPDDNLHMGMIAQEVEKVVPEVVHTADDEMKTKAVEYQYVVGLLVEAIKELKAENDALKASIEALEKKL